MKMLMMIQLQGVQIISNSSLLKCVSILNYKVVYFYSMLWTIFLCKETNN